MGMRRVARADAEETESRTKASVPTGVPSTGWPDATVEPSPRSIARRLGLERAMARIAEGDDAWSEGAGGEGANASTGERHIQNKPPLGVTKGKYFTLA